MPDWKRLILERIAPLHLEPTGEAHLAEELAQHLEDCYREARSAGANDEEAYANVVAELDDLYPLREEIKLQGPATRYQAIPGRETRPAHFLDDLWQDVRYALRALRKSPAFALFVILTLGLGIGANTTVFTLINSLILNPLPVADTARLASLQTVGSHTTAKNAPLPLSYANLRDYQSRNAAFASLAGYTAPRIVTWQPAGPAQRMFAELVTGNYFATLGLKPFRGRFFLPEEDRVPGGPAVAVMNYASWQTLFGGSPDIIGKTLRINQIDFTVVGIAPPKFIGVNAVFGPDLWIPATMAERLLPNEMQNALSDRSKAVFTGVGRLKRGVSRAQAQADLTIIAASLARTDPSANEGHTALVGSLRDILFGSSESGFQPILFGSLALSMVVAIVLLIACSNVANLLLARSAIRRQEMGVRLAMGASRSRLLRQLLTESTLLGLLSGVAGLVIGYAALHLLLSALPGSANFFTPSLDTRVLGSALAVSLATGVLFGIVPALRYSRTGVAEALKAEAHTTGSSHSRAALGRILLTGQVAFSFLLLVTATLFLRSIGRAYEIDPGFQTKHLAVFSCNPGEAGYQRARTKSFYRDVRARVAQLPGVQSVSWSSNLPLWSRVVSGLEVEGRAARSRADKITTVVATVDLNYFETAGVKIESGRDFADSDREDSAPVAIVNQKLARDFWPGGNALGKRIRLPGQQQMREIVGIARTANYTSWGEPPQFCVYVPMEQNYADSMTLYIRSKGAPDSLMQPIESEIRTAGPEVLISSPRTGHEIVDNGLFQEKMGVTLLTVFGLLALGLASIGLYGILAYGVNQRKREIGLRMALGASQWKVAGLILKQGMSLVGIGALIGFAAALACGRLLSRALYGIGAADPVSLVAAALVLAVVALVACYLPARSASHIDPLSALREE